MRCDVTRYDVSIGCVSIACVISKIKKVCCQSCYSLFFIERVRYQLSVLLTTCS